VIGINPSNAYAYYKRANLWSNLHFEYLENNLDSLIKLEFYDINKAIELGFEIDVVYFARGELYEKMNDMENACKDWYKSGELGYEGGKEKYKKRCKKK